MLFRSVLYIITQTYLCNIQRYLKADKMIFSLTEKDIIFFLIFVQNIDVWYTLEPSHRGGSNEYPHYMF